MGTEADQTCEAKCAKGYTGFGNPAFQCSHLHGMDKALSFQPVRCAQPDAPEPCDATTPGFGFQCNPGCSLPASLPSHTEGEGPYTYGWCKANQSLAAGESCTIGCSKGYQEKADGTYTYQCSEHNMLIPPSPDCIPCGDNTFNPTVGASHCQSCGANCTSLSGAATCHCSTLAPCNGVDW